MRQTALLILLLVTIFSKVSGQAPGIQWQKCFGGSGNDEAQSVKQTYDGGYVVAGWSKSSDGDITGHHDSVDIWVVRLTSSGSLIWEKSFGGTGIDVAYDIQITSDSGFIIAGYSTSKDGDVTGHHGDSTAPNHGDSVYNTDCWVAKLSASGSLEWQRSLGGSFDDVGQSVQQTIDGGYAVAGYTRSNNFDVSGNHGGYDFWLVKLSDTGGLQWQKTFGGTGYDQAFSMQQTDDGGFMLAGSNNSNDGDVTGSHGTWDVWVVKTSSSGGLIWQKSLGGTSGEGALSIKQTMDGGYILTGSTTSTDGNVAGNHSGLNDEWVVKLSDTGRIEWQKCLGGSEYEHSYAIRETTDSNFVVSGYSNSPDGDPTGNNGNGDIWVAALSKAGTLLWQKNMGGSFNEFGYDIELTSDDGLIVVGSSGSNDGNVSGNHGTDPKTDWWVVKLNSITRVKPAVNSPISVFPNPAHDRVNVICGQSFTYTFVNMLGETLKAGENSSAIDIGDLTPGVYILSITAEESNTIVKRSIVKW